MNWAVYLLLLTSQCVRYGCALSLTLSGAEGASDTRHVLACTHQASCVCICDGPELCCRLARAGRRWLSTPCQSMRCGRGRQTRLAGTSSTTKGWEPPPERRPRSTLQILRSTARLLYGQVSMFTLLGAPSSTELACLSTGSVNVQSLQSTPVVAM